MFVRSIALAVVATMSCAGVSQELFKPGKLPKDVQALLQPGMTLRIYDASGTKLLDSRPARLAALHVETGQPITPIVPAGAFVAKLSGYFKIPLRAEATFHLFARGSATLRINGKEELKAENGTQKTAAQIDLARGYNFVEAELRSPANGPATLRVSWSGEDFVVEPLPPDMLFVRSDDADMNAGQAWRDGRMHVSQHGCVHCHDLKREASSFPELAHRPPSLEGAGARFQKDWLHAWILNPRELRPKATMPAVLAGPDKEQHAADLTAYVLSLGTAEETKPDAAGLKLGEKLYASLGCIACHHFDDPKKVETIDRFPLLYVAAKYRPAELTKFLQAPGRHYPWTRMPDFKLTPAEAAGLAAFLYQEAKGAVKPAPAGHAERGKKLFESVGCAQCHDRGTANVFQAQRLPAPSKFDLGCLAESAEKRAGAPDFGFKKPKRDKLVGLLKNHPEALERDAPAEFSLRQTQNLKCHACHRRDGGVPQWVTALEDEGTLPEILPLLTWTGEKLKPVWTVKLLKGEHDQRARPWLKARMPAFPARAQGIALGLSHEHGFGADEDDPPPPDPQLAAVGVKLMPQVGGFNCVQCHGVGAQKAVAPFEAPGINLLDAAQRLRYSYYPRWMLDPPRIDIATKMPKLSMDGKTTGIKEILAGDARRQFDALWHHIQTLK